LIILLCILTAIGILAWLGALVNIMKSLSKITKPCLSFNKDSLKNAKISVIIPARNDGSNLAKAIESILMQDIGVSEIIVVDDNSVDNTRDIITRYSMRDKRIKYIGLKNLPSDWSPKSYALYVGYRSSLGDILVFLDADTRFVKKDSLGRLVSYALSNDAIISYAPRFYCSSRICKIMEVVLTTISHAFTGFNRVFNPRDKLAWFYGCCWSIQRRIYEHLGTHLIVKNSLVEDKDLAEHAKRKNVKIVILRGWNDVETTWYDSINENIEALTRILWRYGLKKPKALSSSLLIFLGYFLPIIDILTALFYSNIVLLSMGLTMYLILCLSHSIGAKLNGYNYLYTFMCPLGGLVLSTSILCSAFKKEIVWRGRVLKNIT